MLGCYAFHKPFVIVKQITFALRLVAARFARGGAPELIPGTVILLGVMVLIYRRGRKDEAVRESVRAGTYALAAFVPFSLIPGVAFYPAVTTIACFFLCMAALSALGTVQLGWRLRDRADRIRCAADANRVPPTA